MTELAHVGGHFDEQLDEQVKRCVGELGGWALGSAEALERNIRRTAVGGEVRLGNSSFCKPSLQPVSKSLPGNSPPATIIANVDVLIGQCLRSPTTHLGC